MSGLSAWREREGGRWTHAVHERVLDALAQLLERLLAAFVVRLGPAKDVKDQLELETAAGRRRGPSATHNSSSNAVTVAPTTTSSALSAPVLPCLRLVVMTTCLADEATFFLAGGRR